MLLSMGTLAMRSELDITGTNIEVKGSMTDAPCVRVNTIDVTVTMLKDFSAKDRTRLERAADHCPIKHSFDSDVSLSVRYVYPD